MNIVDDFTRECVGQLIDTSISGARLTRFMDTLGRKPKTIVCGNGPELTSKAMCFWAESGQSSCISSSQVSRLRMHLSNHSMSSLESIASTFIGFDLLKKPERLSMNGGATATKKDRIAHLADFHQSNLQSEQHENRVRFPILLVV